MEEQKTGPTGTPVEPIVSQDWLIERLVEQVEFTWSSLLVGGAAQRVYDKSDAMRRPPKIGDLVLIDAVGPGVPATERIGWLRTIEEQPSRPIEDDDDHVPRIRMWVIERLDGSGLFKWENVSVLRVIRETRMDHLEPVVED